MDSSGFNDYILTAHNDYREGFNSASEVTSANGLFPVANPQIEPLKVFNKQRSQIAKFSEDSIIIGNLVIWQDTTHVGCGIAKCQSSTLNMCEYMIVCNYGKSLLERLEEEENIDSKNSVEERTLINTLM
ncbi:hypothetical protein GQR58_006030 [Nymphon striatum]|nr:hypothetical protein GQR58_006030 [Nymphon striatum]